MVIAPIKTQIKNTAAMTTSITTIKKKKNDNDNDSISNSDSDNNSEYNNTLMAASMTA